MNEIRVKVTRKANRRFFLMYYDDPITGERVHRSTKKTTRGDAIKVAGKWEAELREGRYRPQANITWQDFRERCVDEKLANKSPKTVKSYESAFNQFQRLINPKLLRVVDTAVLSRFQAKLRDEGLAETSIATHLRHLKSAFRWAERLGLIGKAPMMEIPTGNKSRGRAITTEEFERMLAVVPKIRPEDAAVWTHYLKGLWLSGLRLEESTIVSWDDDAPFAVDLSGTRPRFRIYAEAQKGRRDELLPMTPDFAQFIFETPETDRHGRLFKLNQNDGRPMTPSHAGKIVKQIATRARVLIGKAGKQAGKRAGKPIERATETYATAHDLRRSFGTRWAKRVMPAVLQKLMRHKSVQTTMSYYVSFEADQVADELWAKWAHEPGLAVDSALNGDAGQEVDTFVDTCQKSADSPLTGEADAQQKTRCGATG